MLSVSRVIALPTVFIASSLAVMGPAEADDQIAVFRGTGTVEIYELPAGYGSGQNEAVARYTYSGDSIAAAGGEMGESSNGELALLTVRSSGVNSLFVFDQDWELVASDRRVGKNGEHVALLKDNKVAVVRKWPNGMNKLVLFDEPAQPSDNVGPPIARSRIGLGNITGFTAGNLDSDPEEEAVVTWDDGRLEIFDLDPPNFKEPISSLSGVNPDVKGIAVCDYNGTQNVIAVVTGNSLEVFAPAENKIIASISNFEGNDIVAVASTPEVLGTNTPEDELLPQETELLALLNQTRRSNGLGEFTYVTSLGDAAVRHSEDMAKNNFVSHAGSDGSAPWDRMEDAGYSYSTAGENVAAGYSTAQSVLTGWMNSSGHRANILNAGFCDVGVGYAYNKQSQYGTYWTLDLACR